MNAYKNLCQRDFEVTPTSELLMQTPDAGNDKAILYDYRKRKYYSAPTSKRPSFIRFVMQSMPSVGGAPRCHSFSYDYMLRMLIGALNTRNTGIVSAEIRYLGEFFGNKLAKKLNPAMLADPRYLGYCHTLTRTASILSGYGKSANPNTICGTANIFLNYMNSSLLNLRFPADARFNWNGSIQENYDPGEWCYINNNRVRSDNTSLSLNLTFAAYPRWRGNPNPPANQNGFYLLNGKDFYITECLLARANSLYGQIDIQIVKGVNASGSNFLFSSDNNFGRPTPYLGSTEKIYCFHAKQSRWIEF